MEDEDKLQPLLAKSEEEETAPADRLLVRRIYITVVFLKIGEIDTLKEQYEADILIKARWREPILDRKENQADRRNVDWDAIWNPKLFIENTIGEPRDTAFQMLSYTSSGEAYVIEKRRIKGTFLENLELMDFPFDVQDLTITVMSERPIMEVEIVDDPEDMNRINKQSFIDEQEWQLYKYMQIEVREITNEYSDPSVRRSAFSVKCQAARRPAYFFWNIFLITFLICSLVFATFAVERNLPQNRLQLSFTLVLTSVAFKFVVNQSLPKISYLTYLDKYVLSAMILLTLVCAWHGIATVLDVSEVIIVIANCTETSSGKQDSDIGAKIDKAMLVIMAAGYIIFNIIFCIKIYIGPWKKRRYVKKKEREYTEEVRRLMQQQRESTARYQITGSKQELGQAACQI